MQTRRIAAYTCLLLALTLCTACTGLGASDDDASANATATRARADDADATATYAAALDVLATTVALVPQITHSEVALPIIDSDAPAEPTTAAPVALLIIAADVPEEFDLTNPHELATADLPLPPDGIEIAWRSTSISEPSAGRYDSICVQYNTQSSATAAAEIHQSWSANSATTSFVMDTIEPVGDYAAIARADNATMSTAVAWVVVGPVVCIYTVQAPGSLAFEEVTRIAHTVPARALGEPLPPSPSASPTSVAAATGSPAAQVTATTVAGDPNAYPSELFTRAADISAAYADIARIFQIPAEERSASWPEDVYEYAWHIEDIYLLLTGPSAPLSNPPDDTFADLHERLLTALATHHDAHARFITNIDTTAYEAGYMASVIDFNSVMADIVAANDDTSTP